MNGIGMDSMQYQQNGQCCWNTKNNDRIPWLVDTIQSQRTFMMVQQYGLMTVPICDENTTNDKRSEDRVCVVVRGGAAQCVVVLPTAVRVLHQQDKQQRKEKYRHLVTQQC